MTLGPRPSGCNWLPFIQKTDQDKTVRLLTTETIVNLVSAGLGVAIVPKWTSRMAARGVRYVRLAASDMNMLPLAAGWTRGTRDQGE